jgi:hypothetical protein
MPERFARIAALALVVALIIALPLLCSLFATLPPRPPARPPTLQIAFASPTATPVTPPSPPPTNTPLPTRTPLPSPTSGCPSPATPEPLWVDPVVSPTDLLTQNISVTLGRGREISISNEAGTVTQHGEFSIAQPVVIRVPLAPDTTNHLLVTGQVEYAPNCFYTLQTRVDRTGKPLVIVQTSALPPLLTPTPPTPGIVYIKPFSQVVGLNQDTPNASQTIWLYEASADAPFQILAQQGAFTRVWSQGGTLTFWTLNENVVPVPAPEPRIENIVPEQKVEFVQGNVFACEGRMPRGLILGVCEQFQDPGPAEALVRAKVDTSVLYLVRFNYQTYWVSANVLKETPQ